MIDITVSNLETSGETRWLASSCRLVKGSLSDQLLGFLAGLIRFDRECGLWPSNRPLSLLNGSTY